MTIDVAASAGIVAPTPDERWAEWTARGMKHDRTINRRATAVAIALGWGFTIWLAFVLLFG